MRKKVCFEPTRVLDPVKPAYNQSRLNGQLILTASAFNRLWISMPAVLVTTRYILYQLHMLNHNLQEEKEERLSVYTELLSLLTYTHAYTHTHTHKQPFNGLWSGTTRVGRYQEKHSPTHTHPDHRTSFIIFLHLQRSVASSLFILRAFIIQCSSKEITYQRRIPNNFLQSPFARQRETFTSKTNAAYDLIQHLRHHIDLPVYYGVYHSHNKAPANNRLCPSVCNLLPLYTRSSAIRPSMIHQLIPWPLLHNCKPVKKSFEQIWITLKFQNPVTSLPSYGLFTG